MARFAESGQGEAVPDQFSLFDAPPITDRLFFAIFPDPAIAAVIARQADGLRTALGLGGRPLAPERFHITLHHLGDHAGVRRDIVAMAGEAAEAIRTAPFEVVFDRAASFHNRGNNPFVLQGGDGLEALRAFQRELGLAMARAGLGKWIDKTFTPHVTMLYDKGLALEQAIEPIRWTVDGFTLVHSRLGRTEHIALGQWALG